MLPILPRVVVWPIDDILAQFMHIPGGDRLGVGQLLSKHCGHTNLVGVDARIRGDHWASSEVHSLAHHVHAKQALLLLQQLETVCICKLYVMYIFHVSEYTDFMCEIGGSTQMGVNWHLKDIIQKHISKDLMEFMYFVLTHIPGESYHRWLRSLMMCLCDVFWVLINSRVCWFCTSTLGHILFHTFETGR